MKHIYLLIVGLALSGTVFAQETDKLPDGVEWYDGHYFMPYLEGTAEETWQIAPEVSRTRPSHANVLKKKLERCAAIFKSYGPFNPPQGMKVTFTGEVLPLGGEKDQPRWLPSRFRIGAYATLACDSGPCWETTTDAWITVHFNNPREMVGTPVINDIYAEPRMVADFFGHPEFDRILVPNRAVVVTSSKQELFVPVSREDFILTLIAYFEESISKGERQAASPAARKTAAAAPAVRSDEQQQFDAFIQEIKRYDPELADRLKQTYLEAGIMPGQAKTQAEQNPEVDRMIVLNTWREAVRNLKAELNAMSPSERRSQAWWSNTEKSNVSGLTPANPALSRPLVRLSPNLIDRNKPLTNIQLLVIEWSMPPRSEFAEDNGYNLPHARLSELSRDQKIWQQLFNLIDP